MDVILQPVTSQSIRVTWKVRKSDKLCPHVACSGSYICSRCLWCGEIIYSFSTHHSMNAVRQVF